MSTYAVIAFIILLLYLYLGLKTLLNDRGNKLNILFSLICFAMVIWTLSAGLIYSQKNNEHLFIIGKIGYVGIFFYFPLNLHFHLILSKIKTNIRLIILYYMPAVLLNVYHVLGYSFITKFIKYKGEWVGIVDPNNVVLYLYCLYILFCLVISVIALYKWGRRTTINKEKKYSRFILISYMFANLTSFLMTLVLPILRIYDYQAVGVSFFYLYVIALFYIIVKLRFLNINYSLMAEEIISKINDIVILLDTEMKVIDINNKYTEVLSTTIKEIRKKSFFDLIVENEYLKSRINDIIEKRIGNFSLNINYKKDNEYIITKSYFSEIKDRFGDLTGFLVISTEIKEVKQFQKYFKITNKELEIIELIISGFTYKDTSSKLNVTEKTIEAHLTNIYNKLNINNKIDLIRISGDFNIKPCQ